MPPDLPSVPGTPPEPPHGVYVESLRVPLRWWAIATMFLASVLLALLVAIAPVVAFGVTAGLVIVCGALFLGYGGAQVCVTDRELLAGRARIPLDELAEPIALDAEATRRATGVEADARAFLLLRPYIATSVRVKVTDPRDPAPYWLMSTRHPDLLVTELLRAGTQHRAD